jgi:hypothetical protein
MHFPLSAAYVNGMLTLTFGTGERNDLLYTGDVSKDDNNRFYVVRDPNPTGGSAFSTLVTEADLTNVTNAALFVDPGSLGYYIVAEEGEKFVSDSVVFADHVLAASFTPDGYPACGPGEANFYTFRLSNAQGYFDDDATPAAADRKLVVGSGVPSNPRVTVGADPTDDIVFVTTSEGQILSIEPPLRDDPDSSLLSWRQLF